MKKANKTALFSAIGAAVFIFFVVPYLTNLLMFVRPQPWLVPTGISIDNPWIGFIATYFGALLGGIISGLFTYLGVNKTLNAQKEKDNNEFNAKHRAILELQEIYGAELYLRNIKQKKGRLIITPQYKHAIALDLSDGDFNFIQFRNSGPGKISNCVIKVETKFEQSCEIFVTEVKVPVIFEGESIYVPIDKIKGENNEILSDMKFFIKNINVEYDTYANETIKIVRNVNEENRKLVVDKYSIKYNKLSSFVPLYEIEGTENEWYFIGDLD